jgi:hypothetical protein
MEVFLGLRALGVKVMMPNSQKNKAHGHDPRSVPMIFARSRALSLSLHGAND